MMRSRRTCVCVLSMLLGVGLAAQQVAPPKPSDVFKKGMNLLTGTNVSRDEVNGVSNIREAAKLGYAPAQTVMAFFAETGSYMPAEPAQAADWCKKAAQQGDALGQWCLGRAYFSGIGVSRDLRRAEKWLRSAAEQGNPFAAYMLGMTEVELDYRVAPPWFLQAAEAGLPGAQKRYGLLLKEGRGIQRDKFEAYVWLLIAAEAGEDDLTLPLQELESDLGSNEVERAKSEVRQRQVKVSRSAVAHGCTGWEGELGSPPTFPPAEVQKFCR